MFITTTIHTHLYSSYYKPQHTYWYAIKHPYLYSFFNNSVKKLSDFNNL